MTRVAKANQVPFTVGIFREVFSREYVMDDCGLDSLTISECDLVEIPVTAKNILAQFLPSVYIQVVSCHKFSKNKREPGSDGLSLLGCITIRHCYTLSV